MIELSHIDKTFNAGTVNESVLFTDFNLSIHNDDFISVIGSNGSGKTTMLNLLCGVSARIRARSSKTVRILQK